MFPYHGGLSKWNLCFSCFSCNFASHSIYIYIYLKKRIKADFWETPLQSHSLDHHTAKYVRLAQCTFFQHKHSFFIEGNLCLSSISGYHNPYGRWITTSQAFKDPEKAVQEAWILLQGNYGLNNPIYVEILFKTIDKLLDIRINYLTSRNHNIKISKVFLIRQVKNKKIQ